MEKETEALSLLLGKMDSLSREVHRKEDEIERLGQENRALRSELCDSKARSLAREELLSESLRKIIRLEKRAACKERSIREVEKRCSVRIRRREREFEKMVTSRPLQFIKEKNREIRSLEEERSMFMGVLCTIAETTSFPIEGIIPAMEISVADEKDKLLGDLIAEACARWKLENRRPS